MIHSYEGLEVWQRAMDLVTLVYDTTEHFPSTERYGLMSQLQRSVVSIPSNIAEGPGRRTTSEFLAFLSYSRGSLMEVRTQVEIARRRAYITDEENNAVREMSDVVGRLLNGLINALERKQNR